MIKVLVVEDSPVVREFLVHILSSDPRLEVVGTAKDGEEALDVVKATKPDVITMDIHMPKMNGLEATRRIMETHPVPIVIVSGSENVKEVETSFKAVEAGALAVLRRPRGAGHPEYETEVKDLIRTVKLMSEVKVVRRWPRSSTGLAIPSSSIEDQRLAIDNRQSSIEVVAMGASTGGPIVLQTILSGLPRDFPFPLLIVQHIAPGFVRGFTEWLARSCGFPVEVATDGQSLLPGHAFVAPDGMDMGAKGGNQIQLRKAGSEKGLHPSVSYLFRSISEVYGKNAAGVLLTGMGADGARELRLMKEKGAITIAQDEESSVVYGMPEEAVKLGAATYVLPPDKITALLTDLAALRAGESAMKHKK